MKEPLYLLAWKDSRDASNAIGDHLDACRMGCRNYPAFLCDEGERLLEAAQITYEAYQRALTPPSPTVDAAVGGG